MVRKQTTKRQVDEKVFRLDKWLWAARFFKTRSIANDAVNAGKVRIDGDRAKSAKEIKVGMLIAIKTKDVDIEVNVTGLSDVRRGAPEAALLYQETEESLLKKEKLKEGGTIGFASREKGAGRPTKRQQREIDKYTGFKY